MENLSDKAQELITLVDKQQDTINELRQLCEEYIALAEGLK